MQNGGGATPEDPLTRLTRLEERTAVNKEKINETRTLLFRFMFILLGSAIAYGAGVTYLVLKGAG